MQNLENNMTSINSQFFSPFFVTHVSETEFEQLSKEISNDMDFSKLFQLLQAFLTDLLKSQMFELNTMKHNIQHLDKDFVFNNLFSKVRMKCLCLVIEIVTLFI